MLGAVLAGGQSRRFGRDKALADIGGDRLIDRAIAALRTGCDAVIVCGREMRDMRCVADRPYADIGPLGGLAAALAVAIDEGFDAVLSVPCDTPDLPGDLIAVLAPGPAIVGACPVIGLWPATLSPQLDAYLASDARRSMRAWADSCDARTIDLARPLANINYLEDLAAFAQRPPQSW